MIINGIDLSELKHEMPMLNCPPTVPGRVVHIDADFLAYMVSYDDGKSLDEMKHNCDQSIEKLRLMAGAETYSLHLTPSGSDKGNRHDLAMLKEYQANRKDKPKPRFLHVMRDWMAKERKAILNPHCEADDSMAMAQYQAIADGNHDLSVIASKDKDLIMVPGLMLNWDTGEITDTEDPFGYIWMDNKKKVKKIRGRGWKYFWAQMLTGDSADNISGLPICATMDYLPKGKPKLCGPVLAFEILDPIKTNKEAFETVRKLYQDSHAFEPMVNYRDGSPITPGQALASEAQLLWMRRKLDYNDVLDWMKETCL